MIVTWGAVSSPRKRADRDFRVFIGYMFLKFVRGHSQIIFNHAANHVVPSGFTLLLSRQLRVVIRDFVTNHVTLSKNQQNLYKRLNDISDRKFLLFVISIGDWLEFPCGIVRSILFEVHKFFSYKKNFFIFDLEWPRNSFWIMIEILLALLKILTFMPKFDLRTFCSI